MIVTDDKGPAEVVTVEFVFEGELLSIDSASVSITVVNGSDPDVAAMLDGALQISGTSVFQRIKNGLDKVNYRPYCLAVSGTEKRERAGILPVRES